MKAQDQAPARMIPRAWLSETRNTNRDATIACDDHLQHLFIAMVNHEFRTPLAIIDAAAQNILLRDHHNARAVNSIRMAVQRLLHMIDVCLREGRTQPVAMRLQAQTFDLRALLQDAVAGAGPAAAGRRIELRVPCSRLAIHADLHLLRIAVDNLLENSVQYSPDGSTVTLSARAIRGSTEVVIKDEGTGVRASDHERIFEKYQRSDNTAGIPGAGLGLYLVRTILTAHGGSVRYRRRGSGGSCFVVRIPNDIHSLHSLGE